MIILTLTGAACWHIDISNTRDWQELPAWHPVNIGNDSTMPLRAIHKRHHKVALHLACCRRFEIRCAVPCHEVALRPFIVHRRRRSAECIFEGDQIAACDRVCIFIEFFGTERGARARNKQMKSQKQIGARGQGCSISLSFFLAFKAPPWTSFFCEFFVENGRKKREKKMGARGTE